MSVLTVAQAKDHLNITTDEFDAELSAHIDACEGRIAADVGPLTAVATTSRVRGRGWDLNLPVTPVISLTSVTPVGGTAMDVSTLYVGASGVVEFDSGFGYFPAYRYTVVYQAGRTTCSEKLLMGVKELVRLTWAGSQRGGSKRPGSAPSDTYSNTIPNVGDELPFMVQRWLVGETQAGFA